MGKIVKFLRIKRKIIINAIILILFLIILSASVFFITLDDGKYKSGSKSNVPYSVSEEYITNTKFGSDGIYFEAIDEGGNSKTITYLDIWNNLIESGSNITHYLKTPEELKELMEAEVITQYPYIEGLSEDKLNGTIKFERNLTDNTTINLSYIDKETFYEYINNSNVDEVKKYFTLDESGNVLIGVVDTITEKLESNDSDIDIREYSSTLTSIGTESITYNVYAKTINYKNVISKYTMPFQYLWSLLVVGNDEGFVLELADLVKDSEIVISIYDNITTTENVETHTYTRQTKTETYARVTAIDGSKKEVGYWGNIRNDTPLDCPNPPTGEPDITEKEYEITYTEIYETNTPIIDLTKADVWITDYSKKYERVGIETSPPEINNVSIENSNNIEESSASSDLNPELLNNKHAIELANKVYAQSNIYVKCWYSKKTKDEKITSTSKITTQKINSSEPINNEKVSKEEGDVNFVTILCKSEHSGARNTLIYEIPSWLFEILEQNPDTTNMIELTKFLFNKVAESDLFVTEFSFDEYEPGNFIDIGNSEISQLTNYIHAWEGTPKVTIKADGKEYYEVENDGAGHPTVGYGVDIFNGGHLQDFIAAGYKKEELREFGTLVEKELVDSIEIKEISEKIEKVNAKVSGLDLKPYQIAALVSRAYNCGIDGALGVRNGMTFAQAYQRYWNQEVDDYYLKNNKNANYNHALYTNYMDKPNTSDGKVLQGLVKRRKSEWTLFQTGYDDKANMMYSTEDTFDVELSASNSTKMNALINEAKRIANDDRYGYSQARRTEEFYYDCSSLVYRLYKKYFGISVPTTTAGYGTKYRVGSTSQVSLKPGDVLWRQGHVTIYIGNGQYVAAHGASLPKAKQISVYNDSPSKYTYVYRFITD